VPDDGTRVQVPDDVVVTVASELGASLDTVRVDGTLAFDPTVDTGLPVDTLLSTPGSSLRIGSEADPVRPDATARVVFVDRGPIDEGRDPDRVGRGLIAMGVFETHGAETTPWTELGAAPRPGDTTLSLPEPSTNWSPGDELVIPGVDPLENRDEEVRIASVDGSTVALDRPLEHDHVPPAPDLPTHAVHLTRNVRFVSESEEIPRRGHVRVHSASTTVRHAGCYGLGRMDKSYPFTNPQHGEPPEDVPPNPRARYALHVHVTGIGAEPPHRVEGCVVDGNPGWGVVNHHGHVDVVDSVTYDVFGSGFVAEAGDERGSFRRNFALRSEGSGEVPDSRAFIRSCVTMYRRSTLTGSAIIGKRLRTAVSNTGTALDTSTTSATAATASGSRGRWSPSRTTSRRATATTPTRSGTGRTSTDRSRTTRGYATSAGRSRTSRSCTSTGRSRCRSRYTPRTAPSLPDTSGHGPSRTTRRTPPAAASTSPGTCSGGPTPATTSTAR
jgi:hypothetical protein